MSKTLIVDFIRENLDLSNVDCDQLIYINQNKDSIKNHKLPHNLLTLCCQGNKLTSLPKLSNISLETLICSNNDLIYLPTSLPTSLHTLYCNDNKLKYLPELIDTSIERLNCNDNNLTYLPELPNTLIRLSIQNNLIDTLVKLPISLKYFYSGLLKIKSIDYNQEYGKYNFKLHDKIIINHIIVRNSEDLKNYMKSIYW